jgi:hypothetical protein
MRGHVAHGDRRRAAFDQQVPGSVEDAAAGEAGLFGTPGVVVYATRH